MGETDGDPGKRSTRRAWSSLRASASLRLVRIGFGENVRKAVLQGGMRVFVGLCGRLVDLIGDLLLNFVELLLRNQPPLEQLAGIKPNRVTKLGPFGFLFGSIFHRIAHRMAAEAESVGDDEARTLPAS